ncbi:insulin receptor-like [Cydia fagiglandana]|uniref:insulin receptor-like n=1 Tax=Cydia fagiglandana TaxID=1458189 RepID=UPI002FEE3CFC
MRGRELAGRVACLLLLTCAAHATATEVAAQEVCQSMDIRNNPESMQKLKGCRIIEGQLSIVLMEHVSPKYYNMTFPELYEVTGYILIYRMQHVGNLGDLFPNLSVVRGLQLYKDYSVVIFDNENLVSLGLRSLTHIERGSVRIQHNDRLCYVNTIDWSKIMGERAENNVIKGNYDSRLCGLCPDAQGRDRDPRHSGSCPADDSGRLLCWNEKHCQKVCPSSCGNSSCLDDGRTCCDSHCLGGCDGPGPDQCRVCKDYSLGYGRNRKCVKDCPSNMYKLYRRCVSELECRAMKPLNDDASNRQEINILAYKTLNDSKEGAKCVYICPSGFQESGDTRRAECVRCPASGCSRQCSGGNIDSAAAADRFRGCTIINGDLTISLPATGNIVATLEAAMSDVREIRGRLKIFQSMPLVSLMFLDKIERIIASPKANSTEALTIYNNRNLELLWDWEKRKAENKTLEIRGKVVIQFNPKLCPSEINMLKNIPYKNEPNIENDNGDEAFCNQEVLTLAPTRFETDRVVLSWNPYCVPDSRKLLGYSLYYIMTDRNVTLYEQRDACSDTWNVIDFAIEDNRTSPLSGCDRQMLFKVVANLIPDTRYAAYVKTFTTRMDNTKGAQSPIIYFKTLPGRPSPPTVTVREDSRAQHNVTVVVTPPVRPNGTIIEYVVEVQANSYNLPKIMASSIDYCSNPSLLANIIAAKSEVPQKDETSMTGDAKNGTCQCREETERSTKFDSRAEQERMDTIAFENDLQNLVYVKQTKTTKSKRETRIRRSIDNTVVSSMLVIVTPPEGGPDTIWKENSTDLEGFLRTQHYSLPGSTRELTIENLRHFSWYTVSLWACRAQHPNETMAEFKKTRCSDRAFYTFRTTELSSVDMVSKVRAYELPSNMTLPDVNVTWDPPVNPNGFVVAYSVYLVPVEDNTKMMYGVKNQRCVPQTDYESNGRGIVFHNMSPGNYSITVTPITVSGAGNASHPVYLFIAERAAESGYEWIWGVVGGILIVVVVLAGGAWYARRGLLLPAEGNKLFASVNPEYVSTVYVPDEWEVPRANIELVRELGQGSFGMVYEGIAKGIDKLKPETRCAVKTVNEHATDRERIEFLNEASVMKAFDTFHVVRLLGVVSRGQPTLVVMELMEHGDLKTYLRSHRPDSDNSLPKKESAGPPPTLQNILQMAIEIADGMAYLSAKKFVHRDLAARNCMVAGDLTVKVGDFGMTRDIYETDYYRKGSKGLLPVRWMSPESLKDGVFSSSSDIWSFGVVLWEMATLAMQPYQGLSNEQVLRYVVEGGVMERPEHCPDRLYELMRACWAHRPQQRPTFLQLVNDLSSTAAPYFRHRSFFHTPQGQELFALQRTAQDEEQELPGVNVGAVATGSGSNLFGVSGRLASWVRELSSLRSHASDDAAAEPLQPQPPLKLQPGGGGGPNGVLRDERYARDPAATGC